MTLPIPALRMSALFAPAPVAFRACVLASACAFVFGCASTPVKPSSSSSGVDAKDYAPLAIGDSWTYAMNYLGQTGEMTVTIVGEKDGFFVDDKQSELRHTHDGLRDRQRYLIRGPIQAGQTWKTVVSASAVEHNTIVSVGERCESAAGSFPDCLVVESSLRRDKTMTLHIRWTWARGIGLVKLETEAEVVGRGRVPQVKQSLVRYALKGEASGSSVPSPAPPAGKDEDGPATWQR